MFCTKCGTENADGAKFCKNCGNPLNTGRVISEENTVPAKGGLDYVPVKHKKKGGKIFLLIISAGIVIASIAVICLLTLTNGRKEKQFEETMEAGKQFLAAEEYERASGCFEEAISIEPEQVEAYRCAALAYAGMEEYDRAEEIYNEVTDYITEEYEKKHTLPAGSEAVYREAIIYYGEQGDVEKARRISREISDMTADEDERAEIQELVQRYGGMYRQYYDLLIQYQEEQGEANKNTSPGYGTFLTGLCMASLVDFDQDGREELLLAYADMTNYSPNDYTLPQYVIEVWRYSGADIEKVFEGSGFGNDGGTSTLYLVRDENRYYIREGSSDDFEFDDIWGLEDDGFNIIKELRAESYSDNGPYRIDGNQVSYEAFRAEAAKWTGENIIYGLSRGQEDQDRSLAELEETLERLKSELSAEGGGEDRTDGQEDSAAASQLYREVYGPIIQEALEAYGEYNWYHCYDIDKDGVKELMVQEGGSEADYVYQVYTIQEKASVYLGEIRGGNSGFMEDEDGGQEDYIIRLSFYMAYEEIYHVSIEGGKVEEELVSSQQLRSYESCYSNPYPIESRYLNDLSLLR